VTNAENQAAAPPSTTHNEPQRLPRREPGELSEETLAVVTGGLDPGAALENYFKLEAALGQT
jgi:hypothetical protein